MKINILEGIDPTVLGASVAVWQDSDWENLVEQTNASARNLRKKNGSDQQPQPILFLRHCSPEEPVHGDHAAPSRLVQRSPRLPRRCRASIPR